MDKLLEIRWHGRGGQGAVTASKILADAALLEGKYIQAFPEYGPERMGAPIKSFTRISEHPIKRHCQVISPKVVIVLDPTLLGVVDISEGVPRDGVIIINSHDGHKEIRKELNLKERKLFTVNATKIAIDNIGKNIPNTPMIGALVKATGVLKLESVIESFKKEYSRKFRAEIIEGNIKAIEAAYKEVKSE